MFVCGDTRFHHVRKAPFLSPPVRVFPPPSRTRPLRSRATPWPKGGAHAIRGNLKLTTTRVARKTLEAITQPFWLKVAAPPLVHLSAFSQPSSHTKVRGVSYVGVDWRNDGHRKEHKAPR